MLITKKREGEEVWMERRRRRRAREKSRRSEHNINQFNALCGGAFIIYFSSFFFLGGSHIYSNFTK